jgi:hypothetical protein
LSRLVSTPFTSVVPSFHIYVHLYVDICGDICV